MICPKCGREIPDGTVCPCTLERPPLSDNPALNALKTVGSSPLFLALAVLMSLSALLTVFSSLGMGDAMSNIYIYARQMGLDWEEIEAVMNAMRSTSVVSAVLGAAPAILTAVAMWLHYSTCMGRQNGNISTAGLTICKVLSYISLVGLCIAALLVLCGFAIVIIAFLVSDVPLGSMFGAYGGYSYGGGYSDEEATIAVVVVLAVFALIIGFAMGLAIAYQASIIRMINRTKTVAATGMADDRVSGYLVGMTGFSAVCSLISGLLGLFTAPLTGAVGIAGGVGLILMIVLLRTYGKAMNQVLYPPVQPMTPPMYGVPQAPAVYAPPQEQAPAQVQPPQDAQPPQPPGG